ncbi:type I-MYXAN CRISPR-associated protein Cas6/Cmx6 [Lyngbya aestuarii]|uniref:type I-MYXAN CRISPR-associated protein Cas6/Cmx6 n=1 Tax=Lyngbya aestuarii TaxID=118322 RepID=UPI00403E2C8F
MLATQTSSTATLTQTCTTPNLTDATPYVDLSFGVRGKSLPIDHSYGLFSALAHWRQELHQLKSMSITAITGIPIEQGMMQLTDRSRLLIRLPVDKVPLVYPLAGKSLTIGKHKIRFGIPQMDFLQPAQRLRSHLVVIKGYQEPESFLEAAQRHLEQLGIQGNLRILTKANGAPKRKSVKVKRFTVVGFGLEITRLRDEDSLTLQRKGIGGKHKMGCGVFVPVKER